MKEKFERFKNEKIVINVRSHKQYDEFMKLCEEQGLKWSTGNLPTKQYIYNKYEEETCINYNFDSLGYGDIKFYEGANWKVIKYKDFIKTKQFTKSDLKDNHIVVLRNYDRRAWYCIGYSYDDNLINIGINCNELYDIMEVWEFDKCVWKREEQILDEAEKEYLSYVIRPFRDRVNTIKKIDYVNNAERIDICTSKYFKKNDYDYMTLPYFKKGTMYKGLEPNKNYTLKELGLED